MTYSYVEIFEKRSGKIYTNSSAYFVDKLVKDVP